MEEYVISLEELVDTKLQFIEDQTKNHGLLEKFQNALNDPVLTPAEIKVVFMDFV